MAKYKLSKQKMSLGAGAGVGIAQTFVFRAYVDAQFGQIPFLKDYLPHPWANWSSTGNIIIGGIVFGLSQFTKVFKGNIKTFTGMYGFATIVGGIMNGLFPVLPAMTARARMAPRRAVARAAAPYRAMAPVTPTGIPATKILA